MDFSEGRLTGILNKSDLKVGDEMSPLAIAQIPPRERSACLSV